MRLVVQYLDGRLAFFAEGYRPCIDVELDVLLLDVGIHLLGVLPDVRLAVGRYLTSVND
jgi:hypothetical protein